MVGKRIEGEGRDERLQVRIPLNITNKLTFVDKKNNT